MLSPKFDVILLSAALLAGLTLCAAPPVPVSPPPAVLDSAPVRAFAALPGWFEPQRPGIFVSHGHSPSVGLHERGMLLSLPSGDGSTERILPVSLPGSNPLRWTGEQKLPAVTSYYKGNDRSQWRYGVPQFARVRASSVWPGVDLAVYHQGKRPEYDFLLAPGADLRRVRLQFGRGWRASVDPSGDLKVTDGCVTFSQQKPVAWQQRDGRRVDVAARFRLLRDGSVGFDVPDYDPSSALVIDPVLGFASIFGADVEDTIQGVAVVSDGYWLVGKTGSTYTIPSTITPFQAKRTAYFDVFLAKMTLDSNGNPQLAYFTYVGGSDNDIPAAIAAAPDGTLAVVGSTYSKDFPVSSTTAFQATYGGAWDAFVFKFDPSQAAASQVVFSSFFGGGADDFGTAVAIDPQGHIIVAGTTSVTSLPQTPVAAGYSSASGGVQDVFLLMVDPAATSTTTSLLWATLLGGGSTDIPYAIALDAHGRIYITGTTASANFPLVGTPLLGFLASYENGFVSVVDPSLAAASQLVFSTYFGGNSLDVPTAIALDSQGLVWITGYTFSTNLPVTANAFQPEFSGQVPAFLACLDTTQSGAAIVNYLTYFNGSEATIPFAIVMDSLGRPTIGGYVTSPDLPQASPVMARPQGILQGAFLSTFDPSKTGAAALPFSMIFGGTTFNTVTSMAKDASGNLIVGGYTSAPDFPTTDGTARVSPTGADTGFFLLLKPDPTSRGTGIPEHPGRRSASPDVLRFQDRSDAPESTRPASKSSALGY